MSAQLKELKELICDQSPLPADWALIAVVREECLGYLVWNTRTSDAIVVDAMREAEETWNMLLKKNQDLRFIAVIDTHTHADHISYSPTLAEQLGVPYVMHRLSPSARVHLKVSRD